MNVLVTTIGTSFLTNLENQKNDLQVRVSGFSNKVESELEPHEKDHIDDLILKLEEKIPGMEIEEIKKASAELNGLFSYYARQGGSLTEDLHILLATDTYAGRATLSLVEAVLRRHTSNVQPQVIRGLTTKNSASFNEGIKNMIDFLHRILEPYQENSHSDVIFNITGGFKAFQGYMNIIGMFWADKLVYLFETSKEIITIPRLPVKIDDAKFREHAAILAMLDTNDGVPRSFLEEQAPEFLHDMPEAAYEFIGEDAVLSTWGKIVWTKLSDSILQSEPLGFPQFVYEKQYRKVFSSSSLKQRTTLQQKLIIAATFMARTGDISKLKEHNGMQYDNYVHKTKSKIPLGHIRLNNGDRFNCIHYKGKLYILDFGVHDKIVNNLSRYDDRIGNIVKENP